jgi:hypothetical protein
MLPALYGVPKILRDDAKVIPGRTEAGRGGLGREGPRQTALQGGAELLIEGPSSVRKRFVFY